MACFRQSGVGNRWTNWDHQRIQWAVTGESRGKSKQGRGQDCRGLETGEMPGGPGTGGGWAAGTTSEPRRVWEKWLQRWAGTRSPQSGVHGKERLGIYRKSNRQGFKKRSVMGWFSVLSVENISILAKWQEGGQLGRRPSQASQEMRAPGRGKGEKNG